MIFQIIFAVLFAVCCLPIFTESQQCDDSMGTETPVDQLGPFYRENSPETSRVAPEELLSNPTMFLQVSGKVLSSSSSSNSACAAGLANITVELWYAGQPDADGNYYQPDEFRGQVVTNECGAYNFTQTFPALYPTRPILHNHFRLSDADGIELLVTQMYFFGNGTGYVSADFPRELQAVQVLRDGSGARTVEFNMYVDVDDASGSDSNCTTSMAQPTLEPATPPPPTTDVDSSSTAPPTTRMPATAMEPTNPPTTDVESSTAPPTRKPATAMEPTNATLPNSSEEANAPQGTDTSSACIPKSMASACLAAVGSLFITWLPL